MFPDTPAPPVTTNVPVVVDVDAVPDVNRRMFATVVSADLMVTYSVPLFADKPSQPPTAEPPL